MRVGVFGATGQVGGVMRTLLAERGLPRHRDPVLRLGPLGRHARCRGRDGEITVEDTDTADFTGLDLALFSNGKTASLGHRAAGRRGRRRS